MLGVYQIVDCLETDLKNKKLEDLIEAETEDKERMLKGLWSYDHTRDHTHNFHFLS